MRKRNGSALLVILWIAWSSVGWVAGQSTETPVSATQQPWSISEPLCSGRFVEHVLDHITTVPGGDDVRMFEANGGGVAINDLDNDGDLDVVLANHAGMNTILWNEGGLVFRPERMTHGDSRSVSVVDVDGDGWLDIVFSRRASAPNYWRNLNGRFELTLLPDVSKPLYAINWADLDGDGDLDLVGGTYDAGLLTEFGQEFLESGNAGVYYYQNDDGRLVGSRLAEGAQALALALVDLNSDDHLDILVGNDFAVPDMAWYHTDEGWQAANPFDTFAHSTMSLDFGDIDNDGRVEIFATDMKPYNDDPETEAAWHPIMEAMMSDPHDENDPQVMSNVLQVVGDDGLFVESASTHGIDATGWSWSSKFGDLDQDGFLDLYVVNGMIEMTTFAHLPAGELVESNQVLRNDGKGGFEPVADWGLNSTESGRGMSMGDLDGDGDLDIVINNLRGPAQLFENQLCQGSSLQVDLRWPGTGNTPAIGAKLTLFTDNGNYTREVRASSGYLSGDSARIHFGFPEGTELERLEIRWPDGAISSVDDLTLETLLTLTRG